MTATLIDLSVPVASKQYVRVPISEATGADPTNNAVTMAFPETGTDPATFYTSDWVTISGIYYARCLVGPGSAAVLAIGFYDVYVKVNDVPELPVLFSGTMEVF